MKRLLLGLLSAAPLLAATPATPAAAGPPVPELPVQTFFKKPSFSQLAFSPDGRRIACLLPYEHRLNLAVIDLEKKTKNLLTNFKDNDVSSFLWLNDDRLFFSKDEDGKESPAVMAVNRDGTNPVLLASGFEKADSIDEVNARFESFLSRLQDDPKNILVLARLTTRDWSDVCLMNARTGNLSVLVPNPGYVRKWILDREKNVRLGIAQDGQTMRILHREAGSRKDWQVLSTRQADEPGWTPIAFEGDGRTLLVASDLGRERTAICRYDTVTRQLGEVICEDAVYDAFSEPIDYNPYLLKGAIYNDTKKRVVGFAYRADKARVVWLDDEFKELQRKIDASLPGTTNFILSAAPDDSKQLIFAFSGSDPGVYYLFDQQKKRIEELAVVRPDIDPDAMAVVQPVSFSARDGFTVHAYLTLPRGRAPRGLPLILHPHGGPYGIRDDWRFDPEVQFYANRGFAVLQVNYRGSGGYGRGFEQAGWKKWGLEMQDDLTDAVKWAVAQGIADPRRVVIAGASYGGYATMAGITFTPELYCAAINYVGVTDLAFHFKRFREASPEGKHWVRTRIGDIDNGEVIKRLEATSPSNFAERIRVPLLMAYGKNDPRVPIDEGYIMESALRKAGKPYKLIIEKDEGHGFRKEERSIAFYTEVDEFLKKNVSELGGTEVIKIGPMRVLEMPVKGSK